MSKIYGFDLGPNSLGWSIIDDETQTIQATGVRISQEGVANMGPRKGKEEPWNVQRRLARGMRRNNARHRQRRNQLRLCLQNARMMPTAEEELKTFFNLDPYDIRKRGLDEKLDLAEFGRALYHMMLRRGFKSNRKTDDGEEAVTADGTTTTKAIASNGHRTLGEYLASIDADIERKRGKHTLRSMYNNEFKALWNAQYPHYPNTLNQNLYEQLHRAIFFQRPLRSQKHTIGHCTLEPNKRRSPVSSFVFQEYRILEQLSRLTITEGPRHAEKLTEDEWSTLYDALQSKKDLTFEKIRDILGLSQNAHFNLQDQKKLKGNKTKCAFEVVFGKKAWTAIPDDEQEKIWHTLHFADDPKWLGKYAKEHWGLTDDQLIKLAKLALEKDYSRLSHKAMKAIIPHFGPNVVYSDAAKAAGYHHSKVAGYKNQDKLPDPKNLRNPIVQQALYELKRVTNLLIETYGKPDIIRLELGRELRLAKRIRTKMHYNNKIREANRDRIKAILEEEHGILYPSREQIQKYILWEECDGRCMYTGATISMTELNNSDFEIEHILPLSRSGDDSMANKTLCRIDENLRKSNSTPYELYSGDKERYQEVIDRVKKHLPNKLKKFMQKKLDEGFIAAQLVASQYIAKEALAYLKSICSDVQVSNGRATAHLRHLWGLEKILSKELGIKNRDDHRHHAVDALVIANLTLGMIQALATYRGKGGDYGRIGFPPPWESFRDDAEKSINQILVSHRIKARPRGKLHEETYYGKITRPNGETAGEIEFAVRRPLAELTKGMISNIVDGGTKRAVIDRLTEIGHDFAAKADLPKNAFTKPLYLPGTITPIKSVRVASKFSNAVQLYPDRNLWVKPGSNHHAVIFRTEAGKQVGSVVTLLEVMKRKRRGEPIYDKTPPKEHPDAEFLCTLTINDMFLDQVEQGELDWRMPELNEAVFGHLYRVQKLDVRKRVDLLHHTQTQVDEKAAGHKRPTISTLKGQKVIVDAIGRIKPTDD